MVRGIEVVLTTEGIKATNIRGEELGENPPPARLRGQDVDLSENNRRVALLGEIVQRFGNDLWRETRNRHQDLSKTTHRRSTLLQAGTSPRMRKGLGLALVPQKDLACLPCIMAS